MQRRGAKKDVGKKTPREGKSSNELMKKRDLPRERPLKRGKLSRENSSSPPLGQCKIKKDRWKGDFKKKSKEPLFPANAEGKKSLGQGFFLSIKKKKGRAEKKCSS